MESDELLKSPKFQKYIQLMYKQSSDLNQIKDLDERKRQACARATLPLNSSAVQEAINLKNPLINDMIFDYLTRENNPEYVLLMVDTQLFYNMQYKNMFDNDEKVAAKRSQESEKLLERIQARYIKIYHDKEIVDVAKERVRRSSIEQRIKNKNALVWLRIGVGCLFRKRTS